MLAKLIDGPFSGRTININRPFPKELKVSGDISGIQQTPIYFLYDEWPPRYIFNPVIIDNAIYNDLPNNI